MALIEKPIFALIWTELFSSLHSAALLLSSPDPKALWQVCVYLKWEYSLMPLVFTRLDLINDSLSYSAFFLLLWKMLCQVRGFPTYYWDVNLVEKRCPWMVWSAQEIEVLSLQSHIDFGMSPRCEETLNSRIKVCAIPATNSLKQTVDSLCSDL